MTFLATPNVLVANPHFYDYIHLLKIEPNNRIEMIDGAGQALNAIASGRLRVTTVDEESAEFEFSDLTELDPYGKREVIRRLDPFHIRVKKEIGVFAFCQEVVWRIPNRRKWPCLVYSTRYVFAEDPLAFGREMQVNNLYYKIEQRELIESAKTYYPTESRMEAPLDELLERGIQPVGFDAIDFNEPLLLEVPKRWWRFWRSS
jgi:hypothetical protein